VVTCRTDHPHAGVGETHAGCFGPELVADDFGQRLHYSGKKKATR